MKNICKFNFDTFAYNLDSNMSAMGMPLPTTVFGASTGLFTSLASLDMALNFGHSLPSNLIAQGGKIGTYGLAIGSAGYAGAILGSAVMAANRATRCDKQQLIKAARELGLYGGWIDDAVNYFPEIMRKH
ncbi:hypothetical protein [Vibrio anguillarum]|uniref:Uncharacterized protein n=1 Tax=Vibrio anguillarum TaxID=55601 RepID=A0ABR9Z7P6_VIBAN|nr:hypothetical protein [Vibrio anguillarum]MBF4374423.1 hypothetical protein [Vibrio anguillarum]